MKQKCLTVFHACGLKIPKSNPGSRLARRSRGGLTLPQFSRGARGVARPCAAFGRRASWSTGAMSSLSPEDAPLTSQGKPRSRPGGRRRGGSGSGDAAAAEASGSSGFSTAGEDDGSPGSHGENARRMRHVAKRFLGSYYRDINDAPERVARHYTVRRPRRLIAHSNRAPAPSSKMRSTHRRLTARSIPRSPPIRRIRC